MKKNCSENTTKDKINKLRYTLEKAIDENLPANELLRISQELDKLILMFYKN
ncbi:aspartyl-phosphate phosphatase Spo0E family protein [Clostridiaceae bacterium M8S5]|nr:aspartyl-phosphate phosphatase Spo0E family protein [Clostridiaceae bacterium M8S5]